MLHFSSESLGPLSAEPALMGISAVSDHKTVFFDLFCGIGGMKMEALLMLAFC